VKSKKAVLWVVAIALIALMAYILFFRVQFDWKMFWAQLRYADPRYIAAGIGLIYAGYIFRSWRWAIFLRPGKQVGPFKLIGTQFIGFSAVALFGRIADLSRPYLVAKRMQLTVASQIAVYTVERMFDFGAAALIFSTAFAFAPKNLPHHEVFVKVGVGSLGLTAVIAIFVVVVRISGPAVAAFARAALKGLSPRIGDSIAEKILAFRDGLSAINSMSEFVSTAVMSLVMWGFIALAYVMTAHAFTTTPSLANLSFSQTMLLMAVSIGGSAFQLPIIGWFTQIGITSAAMHTSYGTPIEAATACGALLLIVTFLCTIPAGLLFAQLENVSLKKLAQDSSEEKKVQGVSSN